MLSCVPSLNCQGRAEQKGVQGDREQSDAERVAERTNDQKRRRRLAQDDNRNHLQQMERLPRDNTGIKKHAHCHKKESCESILKRLQLYRGPMTVVGLAHNNTGEERAEGKGEAEQL